MIGWVVPQGAFIAFASLWGACFTYVLPLNHKPKIVPRTVLFALFALCLGLITYLFAPLSTILMLFIGCTYTFLYVMFCADTSIPAALYCSTWVVVTQLFITEVWFFCYQFGKAYFPLQQGWWLVGILLFAAGYWGILKTLAKWMPYDGKYKVGPRQLSSALVLLVLSEVLFLILSSELQSIEFAYALMILLAQLYCTTMLYFQDALFKKSALKQELQMLNRLRYEQKEQYQLAKENIAIINRKCHDLKHQMAAMRVMVNPQEEQEKHLKEIENSIRIYESIVKTGNEVLDTVLTEKSLYCEANKITVNCVADGSRLSFMDPVDVYTILGNALDNAIESVRDFRNAEQRMIDVLVCIEKKFLVIQVINPLTEALAFEDGLPVSTKPHDGYHGFGLKSIRHTVVKYGGFLTVGDMNHCFTLKILIPLPQ